MKTSHSQSTETLCISNELNIVVSLYHTEYKDIQFSR